MITSSVIGIIRWRLGGRAKSASSARFTSHFTSRRLLSYLAVLPIIVIAALLGIILLAVFLALSALAVMCIGLWFWRRRRQLRQYTHDLSREGEFVVIPEDRISAANADKLGDCSKD